jgi:hypothetical protein
MDRFTDMQNLPKPVREHGFEADFAYGPPSAFLAINYAPQVGRLYVDRFGREREETFIMDGSERELVLIDIWDVVAGKYYDLVPTERRVFSEDLIDPQEGRGSLAITWPGVTMFLLPRHFPSAGKIIEIKQPEGKIVETKQIEGLTCRGSIIKGNGTDIHPSFVIECWYAEKIAYVVLVNAAWKLTDGRKAETTFRLSKIHLREPDPKLFQVPADYKPAN